MYLHIVLVHLVYSCLSPWVSLSLLKWCKNFSNFQWNPAKISFPSEPEPTKERNADVPPTAPTFKTLRRWHRGQRILGRFTFVECGESASINWSHDRTSRASGGWIAFDREETTVTVTGSPAPVTLTLLRSPNTYVCVHAAGVCVLCEFVCVGVPRRFAG